MLMHGHGRILFGVLLCLAAVVTIVKVANPSDGFASLATVATAASSSPAPQQHPPPAAASPAPQHSAAISAAPETEATASSQDSNADDGLETHVDGTKDTYATKKVILIIIVCSVGLAVLVFHQCTNRNADPLEEYQRISEEDEISRRVAQLRKTEDSLKRQTMALKVSEEKRAIAEEELRKVREAKDRSDAEVRVSRARISELENHVAALTLQLFKSQQAETAESELV